MQSETLAANAIASSISCTSSASFRSSRERASASKEHHSGTMLRAVPPSITPTFADVSSSIRPRRRSETARDAAAIAERPSSGNMPACEARPWKRTWIAFCEGAPRMISPIGAAWSYTKPTSASSLVRSNAIAPSSPTSSFGVNSSSTPGWEIPSSTRRRAASSITATAALSSAPRIVPAALRTTPSSTTGSIGPVGGTVSRCAQSRSGVPPSRRPGSRHRTFPIVEPTTGPAPSSSHSSPSPSR